MINGGQIEGNEGGSCGYWRRNGLKSGVLAKVKASVVSVRTIGAQGGGLPNAGNVPRGLRKGEITMRQMDSNKYFNTKYTITRR